MKDKTPQTLSINFQELKTHADQITQILKDKSIQEITPQFLQKTRENAETLTGLLSSGSSPEWEIIIRLHNALLTIAFDLIAQEIIGEDIGERFVAQLEKPRNTAVLVDRISDPNRFLKEADQFIDQKTQQSWNKSILEKIENEISDNFSKIKKLSPYTDPEDVKKAKERVESLIENPELKVKILMLIDQKFIEGLSPALAQYVEESQTSIRKAIQEKDITYPIENHRKKYSEICDELEKNIPIEIKDISKEREIFSDIIDYLTKDLVEAVVNGPFAQDLQECTSMSDITKLKSQELYKNIIKQMQTIQDETIKNSAQDILDEVIKSTIADLNSSMPKIKVNGDMVDFDGLEFPVYKSKPVQKKKPSRQLDPKIAGENVILNFKERHTGKTIVASDSKRLRLDNPLEISRQEYNQLQKDFKETKEKIKNGEEVEIPHVMGMVNMLNKLGLPSTDDDFIQNLGQIPSMSEKIKITPDTINTIKKVLKSCEAQLIRGESITILEGEAGVGKNVNIDVIGHYTNRPVFTFACSPKTDREDITYLWTLDEKGTKKLNSLVYEAIRTPGAILVFDEINTLDEGVAKQLNGLFDYRRSLKMAHVNGPEQAEKGVILFGTMNPTTYAGTQPLPQDVSSRADIISQDYEPLFEVKEGILTTNFSEMIKMTSNIPYFWKLLPNSSKSDVKQREKLILKRESGYEITAEKQEKIKNLTKKKMTDNDLLEAWNSIVSGGQQNKYPANVVEGLKDVYELLVYANYVRVAYKANKEGWENIGDHYGEVLFNTSISPRLLYQMLHNIHHGLSARDAFFDVYLGQVPNVQERAQIKNFLKNKTLQDIESEVKEFAQKTDLLDDQEDDND